MSTETERRAGTLTLVTPPEEPKIPYRPYTLARKKADKLQLLSHGGVSDRLRYALVLRLRHSPPRLLSVIYADCVFTLVGDSLAELEDWLDKERVESVQVFDARYHLPPEPGTPVIEKMTIEPRGQGGERPLH